MVHTGLLPHDVLDEENDFLRRCIADDDSLATMMRISENGMKQYRRTRTEASKEGIKKAKAAAKNQLIRTIHPLVAGCDPLRCNSLLAEKTDFVRMLQTFRPAQTVFETGIGLPRPHLVPLLLTLTLTLPLSSQGPELAATRRAF
jgi:hypothetical protein